MKILILSLYYQPDLCAGSFRTTGLIAALQKKLGNQHEIELITAMPNRYSSYAVEAPVLEKYPGLTIHRIHMPPHEGSVLKQIKAFAYFAMQVKLHTKPNEYDLVFATSSRLMTAVLGAYVSWKKQSKFYLDIRDLFVNTIDDLFPKKVSFFIKPVFSKIEQWAFNRADRINIVSQGFIPYFLMHYPNKPLSYFTNGIDEEFLNFNVKDKGEIQPNSVKTVLYAGNIGEGQGLQRIVPELAKQLEGRIQFRIIGDGGKRQALLDCIKAVGAQNIECLPPMNRQALYQEYQAADILFLHLNDYQAFEKVLPSKLFEYAATGKPIWAGLSGFSAHFARAEIENAVVFPPCDVDKAKSTLNDLNMQTMDRHQFIRKYAREQIMQDMAQDILEVGMGN